MVVEIEHGDISNAVVPRYLVFFEGVLAHLPNLAAERRAHLFETLHQYRRSVKEWELDPHMSKVFWDLAWRRGMQFDVVTTLAEPMAEEVERKLDRMQFPASNVESTTLEKLSRELIYRPNIVEVIHANPEWTLKFGGRGRYVGTTAGFAL